jgi:phage terminase small subunit
MTKIPSPKFNHINSPLTLKEQKAVSEYIRTGNKSAAIRSAYKTKSKTVGAQANNFFRKPKIIDALQKALKESKFDDSFAVDTLKKIVDGGMQNIDITRPDTSLKALETYFKLTNRLGGGANMDPMKIDPETAAKKMDTSQLTQALKELDKKQKRILAIISGTIQEGEILE